MSQERVKLRMWNLLIKQEMLNMRSLTNKTANIKYKNLSVYKPGVRATESHIQNSKNLFFQKS